MATLSIKNVAKSYGDTKVMQDVNLEIDNGEFVVFVGPSGCGKSTLLRMIAGLEDISGGEISIDSVVVNEVAPSKRGVAMVFQTYALYPHMTVYNNMAFGLKQMKTPVEEIDRRVREAAKILDIESYLERTPRALSGGQRQRVAIGRAIVREPKVFLFDEPLSNLDAALRGQTRLEIARLHERLSSTMVYVTHDQVEAMTLADKIVVLRAGSIEQVGKPMDLYLKPNNYFVASFIGSPSMNFFEATPTQDGYDIGGTLAVKSASKSQDNVLVGIRPEHLQTCKEPSSIISGTLEVIEQLGDYVLAHMVREDGVEFVAKMDYPMKYNKGDTIYYKTAQSHIHVFDKATEKNIALSS